MEGRTTRPSNPLRTLPFLARQGQRKHLGLKQRQQLDGDHSDVAAIRAVDVGGFNERNRPLNSLHQQLTRVRTWTFLAVATFVFCFFLAFGLVSDCCQVRTSLHLSFEFLIRLLLYQVGELCTHPRTVYWKSLRCLTQ